MTRRTRTGTEHQGSTKAIVDPVGVSHSVESASEPPAGGAARRHGVRRELDGLTCWETMDSVQGEAMLRCENTLIALRECELEVMGFVHPVSMGE